MTHFANVADMARLMRQEKNFAIPYRFSYATNVRRGIGRIDCPKLFGLGLAHAAVVVFPRHRRGVTGHQN